MRKSSIVYAAALLGLASMSSCAPFGSTAQRSDWRVLVYNIHAGKDASGTVNLERVADIITGTRTDLVLLQEVDKGTRRSGGIDQPARLAELTGLHVSFGNTLNYQGGEYGIAVLSRWPIVSDTLIGLPVDPPQERAGGAYEPRGILMTEVATARGKLYALDTHLDASGFDRFRMQEVAGVRELADRLIATGAPVVVGGDFNAEPESAVIRWMMGTDWRDAWTQCGEGDGGTYPATDPVKRIDYLFIPPSVACSSATVLRSDASDHRPVLFVLHPR
jgi:endonuclease/exonuclease/phosphatase family metal-dependent hydrolase